MANPPSGPQFDWKMFRYVPTLVGGIIALVIFFIMTLLHLWQFLKVRQSIMIYVLMGALCKLIFVHTRLHLTFLLQAK